MTREDLISFEKEIEAIYKTGQIRGPIHLRDGNEDDLIKVFQNFNVGDYVFCTWANHLQALLAGIPCELVKDRILEGESMAMNFPQYNFYTSAIVGGICPIATGVAYSLKGTGRKVLCFLGDMAFRTGIAHESIMYSVSHNLPILFIVEDNGKSVGTPTQEAWGAIRCETLVDFYKRIGVNIIHYKYELTGPHSGVGDFISF